MKLELNKRYVRRDGVITGALEVFKSGDDIDLPFTDPNTEIAYTEYGYLNFGSYESNCDIVDEYPEQPYSASQQMQVAIDATLAYPEAMQYLNDRAITFMIRDDDRYHVTTLNDGTYTINESGFLFKQIKL